MQDVDDEYRIESELMEFINTDDFDESIKQNDDALDIKVVEYEDD